jgi:RimJ/RimL family protein N-acetyltransferase
MGIFNFLKSDDEKPIEFKAINLNNGKIEVHPYRESEALRDKEVVNDIYEMFGDISQIPYNHEKYVNDKKNINTYSIVSDYHRRKQYVHFVSHIQTQKIIGQIFISPPVEQYINFDKKLKNTWIIEYYLNKKFWNNGIMSGIIPAVISFLQKQGIKNIGAIVDRLNAPSIRILEKSGFKRIKEFDDLKDLYLIST